MDLLHSEIRGDGDGSGTGESLVRGARSCEPSCADVVRASKAEGVLAYSATFDSPLRTRAPVDSHHLRHRGEEAGQA